jgi:hypothetical protein
MKVKVVIKIAIHKITMTMSPVIGDLRPKNTGDHNALRINCIANIINAYFTPGVFRPSRQIRNADTPIRKYRIIHAGPNSQLGGLKEGFVR